jgi:peptidyl-tRNA hydrolase, PTH1 family
MIDRLQDLFDLINQRKKSDVSSRETETSTVLIVGLGNPGREYRDNRHNTGFMFIDQLGADLGIQLGRMQSKALVGTGMLNGVKVILAKPQTFMNLSGESVSGLINFYKISLDRILVAHDDLDLPFGTLRIRPNGGSGGQRGLASIINRLGTQEFPRLRIGIGRPPGQMEAADYVLQSYSKNERGDLALILDRASKAAKVFIKTNLEQAMNQFNGNLLDD